MDIESTITLLKEYFPKNAIEIKSCLELLVEAIDTASADVLKSYSTYHNAKNFSKIKELADLAESINNVQTAIENYASSLELEDELPDDHNIDNEDESNIKNEKNTPNYGDYIVDDNVSYNLYEDFTHKAPAGFTLSGTRYEARQWKDILLTTCNMLAERNPDLFMSFVNDPTMKGRKTQYFSSICDYPQKRVKLNKVDVYIWTNLSANQIRNVLTRVLKKYDIKINDFLVYLRADYTSLHR